jgi:hypothetical protein
MRRAPASGISEEKGNFAMVQRFFRRWRPPSRARIWSRRLAVALLLATGCVPYASVPVYPLYPEPAHAAAHEAPARLFGPIAEVDGRDVSQLGSAFALLPGSHVVRTRGQAVESTSYLSVVGRPGCRSFAFTMKPGYTYIVKQRVLEDLGSRLRVAVFAEELDATGALARVIQADTTDAGDLQGITPAGGLESTGPDATSLRRPPGDPRGMMPLDGSNRGPRLPR